MSNRIYKMEYGVLVLFLVLLIGQAYQQMQKPFTQEPNISRVLVQQWVEEFGDHIRDLTKLMTAYNRLQGKYSKIIGAASQLDGNAYVRNIARDLEKLLKKKAKAVNKLVKIAEEASKNYTYDKHLNFDYLNNKKLVSDIDLTEMGQNLSSATEYRYIHLKKNEKFKSIPVNTTFSTVHVPTNVYDKAPLIQNGVKWSEGLNNQFKDNAEKTNLAWQYFCSSDGFLRIYPGMKWPRNNQEINIDMYDCRVREWYIKAATSPKNVIILVDTSGSMKGLRMEITRSTIKKILETFSDNDYFNVMTFSENVTYPEPCFKETMMRANDENKKRMNSKLKTEKIANFRKGLLEAFKLFKKEEEKRGPLCNKAIMLLSDGAPESYVEIFKQYNWQTNEAMKNCNRQDTNVRFFSFLIGREVSENRNMKWMACANKGFYTHVSTLADVQENVQKYLRVMSRPLVMHRSENTIWTSAYMDYVTEAIPDFKDGIGLVTSIAMPVYDVKNSTFEEGHLLGVMGTDVPIEELKNHITSHWLGPNGYAFMVTKHGYVLFHPNQKSFYINPDTKERKLKENYKNLDLLDAEYAYDRTKLKTMREKILRALTSKNFNPQNETLKVLVPYQDNKRIAQREYVYYFRPVNGTDFSIVIALPKEYGLQTKDLVIHKLPNENDVLRWNNTVLAPWRYCRSDKIMELEGKIRIKKFYELFEINQTSKIRNSLCKLDRISAIDLHVLKDMEVFWRENAHKYYYNSPNIYPSVQQEIYTRFGIELVFVGTSGGLTRWHQNGNLTDANFIKDNLRTVENLYYKRAAEGQEEGGYNYTFSIPLTEKGIESWNTTVVTVTMDVKTNLNVRVAVVGLQMKYRNFMEKFIDIVNKCSDSDPYCLNCQNETLDCFLLDNNGFVLAAERLEDTGKFFGDVEGALMNELVKKGIYERLTFTDHFAVCEIHDGDDEDSGAEFLLNPFKKLFNLFIWTITEIALFISHWDLSTWAAVVENSEEGDGEGHVEDQGYATLDQAAVDQQQGAKLDVPKKRVKCSEQSIEVKQFLETLDDQFRDFLYKRNVNWKCYSNSKIIPCHKNITLYKADFSVFHPKKPIDGSITTGCFYCPRPYVVQWIEDTNLIFITAWANEICYCEPPSENNDTIIGREIENEEEEMCKRLHSKSEHTNMDNSQKKRSCIDNHPAEDCSKCGTSRVHTISPYLILILIFSICKNSYHYMLS